MADPSPAVRLPGNEWIELFNTTNEPVNLRNWRLTAGGSLSGAFPEFILSPHEYVIICAASARTAMEAFGKVLTVTSFPSLDNAGEALSLRSANGQTIHAVHYSANWHENVLKKEGGWTLEMVDLNNPCAGKSNWRSSIHPDGGTPGIENSVKNLNPDNTPPLPLRSYSSSNKFLHIVFDEPVDSTSASDASLFKIDNGLQIIGATCQSPLFDEVILETDQPMDSAKVYNITVGNIRDCRENRMQTAVTLKAGVASTSRCVINEIMFDPKPGGYDYIEIYNAGSGILDASQLYLGNRTSTGQPGTPSKIIARAFALFPGEYLAITENLSALASQYTVKDERRVLEVVSMPSMPNDKGSVLLLDVQGEILDEVNYSKSWHHPSISDPEGVALERVDFTAPSQRADNWHSAATTAGYGTPGYVNSQVLNTPAASMQLEIYPNVFSPDNDGLDDIATIIYKGERPGFLANVFVFDASGRQVKHLVRNELTGTEGYWRWNGLDDRQQVLPMGIYIIQLDLFNTEGKKERLRKAVVLAKRLQ